MKNKFFVGLVILALLAGMLFVSCDDETHTFTFKNNSSHEIKISCSDLDPSSFTLSPSGGNKTATSTKTSITFYYSIGALTEAQAKALVEYTSNNGVVTFKNK